MFFDISFQSANGQKFCKEVEAVSKEEAVSKILQVSKTLKITGVVQKKTADINFVKQLVFIPGENSDRVMRTRINIIAGNGLREYRSKEV